MSEIYPYLTYIALLLKKDCPVLQCRNAPNLITHSIIDGHLVVSIFFFLLYKHSCTSSFWWICMLISIECMPRTGIIGS